MSFSGHPRLIVPGSRVGELLLGKPFLAKTKLDGYKPRVSHDLNERSLLFEASGIDLCIDARTNKLKSIGILFTLAGQRLDFNGATVSGIRPGSTEAEIIEKLGKPDKVGSSYPMPRKRMSRSWCSYDNGIAFEFSADKRADLITIFPGH